MPIRLPLMSCGYVPHVPFRIKPRLSQFISLACRVGCYIMIHFHDFMNGRLCTHTCLTLGIENDSRYKVSCGEVSSPRTAQNYRRDVSGPLDVETLSSPSTPCYSACKRWFKKKSSPLETHQWPRTLNQKLSGGFLLRNQGKSAKKSLLGEDPIWHIESLD